MKKSKTKNKYRNSDELLEKIESLIPKHPNTHRFGGSRSRVADRKAMDGIFFCTADWLSVECLESDRYLLEQYPNDIRILNDLAWILQEHYHRYAAALELANRGLSLAPNELHLLDTRGTILSNLPNRLADARNDFKRLVELSTSDTREQAKALLQLGRICAKLNDLV